MNILTHSQFKIMGITKIGHKNRIRERAKWLMHNFQAEVAASTSSETLLEWIAKLEEEVTSLLTYRLTFDLLLVSEAAAELLKTKTKQKLL